MQTEYLINEITGNSHMLGIRLTPGGIAAFIPYPASEFHNETIALDDLWGRFADNLRDALSFFLNIVTFPYRACYFY